MIRAIALVLVLSSTPAIADQYASLDAALSDTMGGKAAFPFPADQAPAVKRCIGLSAAKGIPGADQARLLKAFNSHQLTPDAAVLLKKWLGIDLSHGAVVPPDPSKPETYTGGLHYADGTAVGPDDGAAKARIRANMKTVCPDLEGRIRDF